MTNIGTLINKSNCDVAVVNSETKSGFTVQAGATKKDNGSIPWDKRGFVYIATKSGLYQYTEINNYIHGAKAETYVAKECSPNMQVVVDESGEIHWEPLK